MASRSNGSRAALSVRGLIVSIDGISILKGIDLDVPSGKVTGLAGESGSGKSMTGMAIMGLLPDGADVDGSIMFEGRELLGLRAREINGLRGQELAMVFQDPSASLHPMLTVGRQLTDHIRHHLKLSKDASKTRAIELLGRVQVPNPEMALKRYPHQFSGGQLQRIAIAIAIACDPKLLIADEPTTALDVTVQAGILGLLRELCCSMGLSVILITHDFGVMSAVTDTISVLRYGEVVESGDRYNLIRDPKHPYTRELIESLPQHKNLDNPRSSDMGGL